MSTPADLLRALGREARGGLNGASADPSVRVYRGRSVEDIIPQIQRELGADAIIVRRRDGLAGGVLGFFQHPYVEIEAMPGGAGVDVYDEDEPAAPPPAASPPLPAASPPLPAASPPPLAPQVPPLAQAAPEPPAAPPPPARPARSRPSPRPAPQARAAPPPPATAPPRAVAGAYGSAELAALARAGQAQRVRAPASEPAPAPVDFHELIAQDEPRRYEPAAAPFAPAEAPYEPAAAPFAPAETPYEPAAAPFAPAETPYAEYAPPPPPPARAPRARATRGTPTGAYAGERRAVAPGSALRARAGVEKGLRRAGVSEGLAHELIDGAAAHALPLAPRSGLAQAVRTTLAQRIPVAPPLPTRGAAIVVVGAGGTGKSTCCAALLGAYRRGSTLPASFATLTRGEKRGELRLLLAPGIVKPMAADTPRALGALRRARGAGLAVLDTPRLSPADKAGIRALALLLGELKPERIVVALPATLGATAAGQLLSALAPLGANALAVTHVDETDQLGVAIEAACAFGLAPEYLLDCAPSGGWRLRRVDPAELASRLLP